MKPKFHNSLILVASILLCSIVPSKSWAYDVYVDGIYYNLNNQARTAEVTRKPTNSYSGDVVIPESFLYDGNTYTVTSIGEMAFYPRHYQGEESSLTSVTIPNSVKYIEDLAFARCKLLTSITIPNADIYAEAFVLCTGLTSLTIGSGVSYIFGESFSGCSSLTSITIDATNPFFDSRDNCNAIIETSTNTLILGCKNTVIPNSVTSIGDEAFSKCTGLTSVEIPNSVTEVGESSFSGCTGLTSVVIPNSVTSIGRYAFNYCTGLASVAIPNSVTSIGYDAFSNTAWYDNQPDGLIYINQVAYKYKGEMTMGTEIAINSGTISISGSAFSGCTGLTSVEIPNGVTEIGESSFSSCTGLTSVEIPNSVTSIGSDAFSSCTGLTSVEIPNSVTSIGRYAFFGCTGLTSVAIPNSVTSIGSDAFYNTAWYDNQPDGLIYINQVAYKYKGEMPTGTEIAINSGTISISGSAFSGCTGLTSVEIPNSVTEIGESSFSSCTGLTSLAIPNSVTEIGNYAFSGCTGLTSVAIPNSVTCIDFWAFSSCSSLTSITVERESPAYVGVHAFRYIDKTNCTLYVPVGSKPAYESATGWKDFQNIVEPSVLATGSCGSNVTYTLYSDMTMVISGTGSISRMSSYINNDYYQSIKEVIIEEGVTTILESAFINCTSLTSVEIPNSVTRIDNQAFYGTAWYDNQPDGLVYAGKNVYKYKGEMPQGTEIVIEEGTLTIGYGAFSRCTGLVSVTIPNSVTTIRPLAFLGCTGLSSITIPESVTGIEDDAFIDCTSLTSITVECVTPPYPASVEADYANCVLYVPYGSKTAYENAWVWSWFENIVETPALIGGIFYDLDFTNKIATVVSSPDDDYQYSGGITIPESIEYAGKTYAVTEIGLEAFSGCTGLTSVDVPNSVTRIVEGAFYGCTSLTSVEIPNSVTYIDDYTFDSCTGLTSVDIPNSVTNIGFCAFGRCTGLTSVDIPNSVTRIGDGAFVRCIGLTSINIPNSVIEIGVEAFENCTSLTSITLEHEIPIFLHSSAFENVDKTNCTLYVPVGSKTAYENAEGWKEFENIVEISEEPDTDISEYDNIVYIESAEALVGQQIRLSLKMNNTIASTGFQCDIYLPEGVMAAQDEDGFYLMDISEERTTTRKTDYSASVMQPDGGLRFMCSSTNSFTFSGNEGEVAYLMVDIDPNMEEGTYPLILRNISISDANAHAYHVDYVKTTLTIHTYTLGDANNDGGIDVADFTAIANYIMGTPPASFVDKAADVNVDDEINVADLTGVANLILHGTVSPNASHAKARNDAAAKYANIGANDVTANSDEEFTVAVTIDGNYAYSGYQFDVTLPEGMTVKDVYGQTKASDVFMSGMIDDNTLRVLCASTTGETADNTVVNLTLVADSEGSYNIDIDNAFVSANASSCAMRNSSFLVAIDSEATGISTMGDESSSNDVVYDLMGKKLKSNGNVSSLQRGIYIINGKKITK